MLNVSNVTKSYAGVHALQDANLYCQAGEVHAVLGENGAGKSTLVNVLSGAVLPDAGQIELDGTSLSFKRPKDALANDIVTVFQEISLVPHLTVADNLMFDREPRQVLGRISKRKLDATVKEALESVGITNIDVTSLCGELNLRDRQMLEIAKAILRKPKVLILDEATSSLPAEDVEWLFAQTRGHVAQGGTAIFISHRMEEVRELCQSATIFRNGRDVGSGKLSDFSDSELVRLMLNRSVERFYPPRTTPTEKVVFSGKNLTAGNRLKGVDFDIREGEILGIGGLDGQGQREVFLGLFGALPMEGDRKLHGEQIDPRSPGKALSLGIGLVPEDRSVDGLCLPMSIRDNISLGNLGSLSSWGFMSRTRETQLTQSTASSLQVSTKDLRRPVQSLSGGNQQKVLLGRVLARAPQLLMLYDATRGVDVGTKAEIYDLMLDECSRGVGILFFSTDTAELANMAHRVLVFHDGRVARELHGAEVTEESIVEASIGAASGSSAE